jgi:RNA 2',3'-cyclic 3'-phosphodiesterase
VSKRLFIAVDVDEATRGQIARIATALRGALDATVKASWVRPDRMHLTLHFSGSADARLEQRALDALAHPVRESPFDVTFDRLGLFPEHGSPRVVWLGVRDGLEPLRRIHRTLIDELRVQPDHGGPLTPHLTLARIRVRVPRAKFAQIGAIRASAGPSRIDRVTLYESRLSPAGPTYVPLAAAHLQP